LFERLLLAKFRRTSGAFRCPLDDATRTTPLPFSTGERFFVF
jgi:hypothetical protein